MSDFPGESHDGDGVSAPKQSDGDTLGSRLVKERELQSFTVEQIALQLNLAPRQIVALENDNYGALPGMASVRGFVRAYAKLLKIDAAPLVAMISSEQITPTQPLESQRSVPLTPFSDNRFMLTGHRRHSSRTIVLGIAVVVLIAVAIFLQRNGGWAMFSQSLSSQIRDVTKISADGSRSDVPVIASDNVDASASMIASVLPSIVTHVSSVEKTEKADDGSKVNSISNDQTTPKVMTLVNSPQETAPASDNNSAVSPVASNETESDQSSKNSKSLLVLKLREDSWVQVKIGHTALISKILKAGSTETVELAAPADLTLGNASGVDAIFRGKPLEIKSDAKSNVIRLSLK